MIRWSRVLCVLLKDWREFSRSGWLVGTAVALTVYFGVVLPAIIVFGARVSGGAVVPISIPVKLGDVPLAAAPEGLDEVARSVYAAFSLIVPPLFLVIPLAVSTVMAADSFAGERERGTIEVLLAAPLTERELFLAKALASLAPGVAASWGAFALMALATNLMSGDMFGGWWFPSGPEWYVVVALVSPLYAFLAISLIVLASSRARSAREAQQASAILVAPILVAVFGQVLGGFALGLEHLLISAAILAGLDAGLVALAPGRFFSGVRYMRVD